MRTQTRAKKTMWRRFGEGIQGKIHTKNEKEMREEKRETRNGEKEDEETSNFRPAEGGLEGRVIGVRGGEQREHQHLITDAAVKSPTHLLWLLGAAIAVSRLNGLRRVVVSLAFPRVPAKPNPASPAPPPRRRVMERSFHAIAFTRKVL